MMAFDTVRIASSDGATEAQFVPEAGMLCCSLRHLGEEVLDVGKSLDAYAKKGSTTGIPLLYPWANRIDGFDYRAGEQAVSLPDDRSLIAVDPNGLPIHGALPGLMRWRADRHAHNGELAARLVWNSPQLLELFPFEHELQMAVRVESGALTVTTTVLGAGGALVPVSFGFHPYLRLPGSARQSWRVAMPALQQLALDERMIPTGRREPFSEREFTLAETSWDDGFELEAQPGRFAVTGAAQGISVELLTGFPYAQIYAPLGHDYVCFEPMTAPTNALQSGDGLSYVAPGEQYSASFRVRTWRD